MTKTIDEFIARVKQRGILKPTKYSFFLNGNGVKQGLADDYFIGRFSGGNQILQLNELLSNSCEKISIPNSDIASKEVRIAGPPRDIPYERLFSGEITVTFRLDAESIIRRFFLSWQNKIVDPRTNQLEFYDNYTASAKIIIQGDVSVQGFLGFPIPQEVDVYECELMEVYPKSVSPLELGFEDRDTYLKQTVQLQYRKIVF